MAHESFEDPQVADVVNAAVVAVKVDREERPDVDAVYMNATQAMTGHGGWPMTVFATPDGEPFFCGTYYPPPAFLRLVRAVGQAWRDQRGDVLSQSAAVAQAIRQASQRSGDAVVVTPELLDEAAATLGGEHDTIDGGFSGAPKFPPHMSLLFLLRHYHRTGDRSALEIVRHTCEAMARGGIYDQLGGGFARYSVDESWVVPHFEKMLYDNALLLRVYTYLWRLTGDRLAQRVAGETVEFLIRDLLDGAFASSLDADTCGVEGDTYVWTPEQLHDTLGPDGAWAVDLFGVTGTFERGTSVLRLARDVDAADVEVRQRHRRVRQRLFGERARRPQPARDAKVVAAWNGQAITALVEFAAVADPPDAVRAAEAARTAAELLLRVHLVDGRLRRVSRGGVAGAPAAVLDDHGCVAEAFCAMHQLTGEGHWLLRAGQLLDLALERFSDGDGGFFDTADDAERLVARPADATDNATPSGVSSVVAALVAYSALTGHSSYREAADRALRSVAGLIPRHARFAGYLCAAAEAMVGGPVEVAVVDPGGDSSLARAAWRLAPPGAVVVVGAPNQAGVPLLAGRDLVDGEPTAYVCRGFVCDRPVTSIGELTAQLAG